MTWQNPTRHHVSNWTKLPNRDHLGPEVEENFTFLVKVIDDSLGTLMNHLDDLGAQGTHWWFLLLTMAVYLGIKEKSHHEVQSLTAIIGR